MSFFWSKLPDRLIALNLKFLVKYVYFILLILPVTVHFLLLKKYFVNNKITASCPTKMDPKYYVKCYKLQKKKKLLKTLGKKFSKPAMHVYYHEFHLSQVHPSLPSLYFPCHLYLLLMM